MKSSGLWEQEFTRFVETRSANLVRTAYLLCGDRHRAEDVVQIALAKLYVAWSRARRTDSVDAYARQVLVRVCIDESRRPWRRELSSAEPWVDAEVVPGDLPFESPVLDELRRLPSGQRAAVVLRYWQDLSVEDTARLMGCSRSTVKTQAARGLDRLRAALTAQAVPRGADHD